MEPVVGLKCRRRRRPQVRAHAIIFEARRTEPTPDGTAHLDSGSVAAADRDLEPGRSGAPNAARRQAMMVAFGSKTPASDCAASGFHVAGWVWRALRSRDVGGIIVYAKQA